MGVLGGLQILRTHNKKEDFEDPNLFKNILHTLIPLGCECTYSSCRKNGNGKMKESYLKARKKIWKRRVDFNVFLYVGLLLTLTIIKGVLDMNYLESNKGNNN